MHLDDDTEKDEKSCSLSHPPASRLYLLFLCGWVLSTQLVHDYSQSKANKIYMSQLREKYNQSNRSSM